MMLICFSCFAVFASHPAVVLFASSWVVAALGYGALDLLVTTDPVEIWAAPQSRSRIEREYFDSRFEPFYRTEQVFVKAVGIEKVIIVTSSIAALPVVGLSLIYCLLKKYSTCYETPTT